MTNRIERVVSGNSFPRYAGEDPAAYQNKVELTAEAMRRSGVTHVIINQAVASLPWAMDPENSYLRFTTYGHSPDKYVTSSYCAGIYHEELLEANRQIMLHQAALAKRFGFRCAIRCVEPTLMPESFFRRHPALRGPRVDNPGCSTTPYYALCPMVPEVQDHCRQLMENLLALVPEIDEFHIFTNDSGAGVCYSSHLYAGPNGPGHCRKTPPGKQAQVFASTIMHAARKINPAFRVVMTSGLAPSEKEDYLRDAPEGVCSAVYGAYAWGGGLEEHWARMAVGPKGWNDPEKWREARAWQEADFRARIDQVKRHSRRVYACYSYGYYLGSEPQPFQVAEMYAKLMAWGVTDLIGGGEASRWSVNSAVVRHILANGPVAPDEAVKAVASAWVAASRVDRIIEAWRCADEAVRLRPMPQNSHWFLLQPLIKNMPIAPATTKLTDDELAYFMTPVLRDEEKMANHQGGVWRVLNYGMENKKAYVADLEEKIVPRYEKAIGILDELLAASDLSGDECSCLKEQRTAMANMLFGMRRMHHWIVASAHIIREDEPSASWPALRDIIDREIALLDERARADGKERDNSPRCELMRKHRDDAIVQVSLAQFPLEDHLGLSGWEGAHEMAPVG